MTVHEHQHTEFREVEVEPTDPFTVELSADGRWYTVTGLCPTCRADTVFRVSYGVLGPTKGWRKKRRRPEVPTGTIPVYCMCGYPHPEKPQESSDSGCGAFWEVPVPSDIQGPTS